MDILEYILSIIIKIVSLLMMKSSLLLLLAFISHLNAFLYFDIKNFVNKNLNNVRKSTREASLNTFTQAVDHFDPTNVASFQQRYLYSNGTKNIAFLMVDGEASMGSDFFPGIWIDIATEVGAYTFELEHRYYGKSQPFDNMNTTSLKYLSSNQAIADAATFISFINEEYNFDDNITWIAFGGSYPGALAAWIRYKYPHLVHGVISSSAPLRASVAFPEYLEVVVNDINQYNASCLESISNAFVQIRREVENNNTELLIKDLYLCDNFDSDDLLDNQYKSNIYRALIAFISYIAQYSGTLLYNFSDVCSIMTSESYGNELQRYGEFVKTMVTYMSGTSDCLDVKYSSYINFIQNESLIITETSVGIRQWTYQTCTEFGWFQTTDTTENIFGSTHLLEYNIKICQDAFGDNFNNNLIQRSVNNTNISKGGTELEVSNVVFVQGSLDPWHTLGINESSEKSGTAILIQGASHGNDMLPASFINSTALEEARYKIKQQVLEWIGNNY